VRVSLLAVGRPRQRGVSEAIQDYETRAARYWPLDIVEVKEESSRAASPALVRNREAERLTQRLAGNAQVIACDPGGEVLTSEGFAQWLMQLRERAENVAFVIGGAHGLGDAVRSRASRRLSLAPWTLPHELARLVLMEQLYRAGTIARGEPYHK
jgi:23S rRNA (pseudouridine1915-N3)-methyltransferase